MDLEMGTRAANREGSYRQKWRTAPDGQRVSAGWEGRVFVVGLGQVSRYGATRKAAQKAIEKLLREQEQGLRPLSPRYTLGEWLDDWLALYVAPNLARRTFESYRDTVKLHIKPTLGWRPLSKLQPEHIAAMLAEKSADKALGPVSVRYIYAVLRISLGRALKAGKVHRNVAALVDRPQAKGREVVPLTDIETRQLITALADDPDEALIVTLLTGGLRKAELLGLTWPLLDRETGRLTVRYQLGRHGELTEDPKRGSRRTVTLPPTAVAALRLHWARWQQARLAAGEEWAKGPDGKPLELVFCTAKGVPLDHGYPNKALNRVITAAGLPHQRVHDMRHAYTTLLLAEGVELAIVSKLLGHADFSTTADVYGHLTEGMRKEAAARLEAALRRTS